MRRLRDGEGGPFRIRRFFYDLFQFHGFVSQSLLHQELALNLHPAAVGIVIEMGRNRVRFPL